MPINLMSFFKKIVNYPAAELRGIKDQKQDVQDNNTSFIEFIILPLVHKVKKSLL